MIHRAMTLAIGNAVIMFDTGEMLRKIDQSILDIYRIKTGKKEEDIAEAMESETWFTSSEALEFGLADATYEPKKLTTNAVAHEMDGKIGIAAWYTGKPIKKEEIMEIKNLADLKSNFSELLNEYKTEILNEAATKYADDIETARVEAKLAERTRIMNLEKIAPINEKQKEILNKAKYEDEKDPRDLALLFLTDPAYMAAAEINKLNAENDANGINGITATITEPKTEAEEDKEKLLNYAKDVLNKQKLEEGDDE